MSVRRRGNGLTAESYVLLLDVDPRLADPLLAALATAGVAAYVTPTTARSGPLLELHPPSRPLEAVHVDSTRRPAARRVLESTMPDVTVGMPSIEEEDRFAALVAGWDTEPDEHSWPDVEDLDTPEPPSRDPVDLAGGPPRRRRTDTVPAPEPAADAPDAPDEPDGEPGPKDDTAVAKPAPTFRKITPPLRPAQRNGSIPAEDSGGGDSGAGDSGTDASDAEDLADAADDHYLPPELPPLPPSHPVTRWGLVALGLGLVLLIFPTLLGLEHTDAVDVVGVLCILGAVGLLVSRLSSRSTDEYDGPDDGAIV
ncbi:MAG TPA: hypothetical protein VLR26_09530 [Frankiaceae bacterium]|nr:hypothetical protein [Frankiaceae bacterium]